MLFHTMKASLHVLETQYRDLFMTLLLTYCGFTRAFSRGSNSCDNFVMVSPAHREPLDGSSSALEGLSVGARRRGLIYAA